jgi:RNA ligase (TIGR02306 family)
MSEFHVNVVRLTNVSKHPNADSLYIAKIHGGYPIIFKGKEHGGAFSEGDLAVYIPVDSMVPATKEYAWLSPPVEVILPGGGKQMVDPEVPREKDRRVRAKRLRGVFSMGMLGVPPEGAVEGQDVAELMGITKYEEPEEVINASRTDGFQVPAPRLAIMPGVYDIEGLRRYTNAFRAGEAYVCTEKLHGQNARFVHDGEKLHVGSRTRWLTTEERNTWSDAAARYELATKLAKRPKVVFFGETYGNNGDMPYGVERSKTGDELRFFDAFCSDTGRWLDHDEFLAACDELGLDVVPELCRGTWGEGEFEKLTPLAEGKTTLLGSKAHVREGFVIKPLKERCMDAGGYVGGRLILKLHGEGYLTRRGV